MPRAGLGPACGADRAGRARAAAARRVRRGQDHRGAACPAWRARLLRGLRARARLARAGAADGVGRARIAHGLSGSLRGLSAFDALVADRPREADWRRDAKLRLTRDDVVSRLGAPQMPAPAAVDRLVLLAYDPGLPSAAAQDVVLSQEARLAALRENDLTREDEVRARWLGWFTPRPDPEVARLIADRALRPCRCAGANRARWARRSARCQNEPARWERINRIEGMLSIGRPGCRSCLRPCNGCRASSEARKNSLV